MGLFSSKTSTPTESEINTAGQQIAKGDTDYADQLVAQSGKHGRAVAMQILAASADHTNE